MDYISFIREVEKDEAIAKVSYKRMPVWPFLRNKYWSLYRSMYEGGPAEFDVNFKLLKNVTTGCRYLFHSYDHLFLSNNIQRRPVESKSFDILLDPIIDALGRDRSLLLELPGSPQVSKNPVYTKKIASDLLFRLVGAVIAKVRFERRGDLINAAILDAINRKYNLPLDYRRHLKIFNAMYHLRKFMLRIYRPRTIFVRYYPSFMATIKAAHDLGRGIKVVELQHGVIGFSHPAYHAGLRLDKSFFPDYLLSFGNTEKEIFKVSHHIFDHRQIIPIGSFYIDHMLEKEVKIDEIDKIKRKKTIIAVTGQEVIEHKLLPFLIHAANLSKDIIYIYIPRGYKSHHYKNVGFPENILILDDYNFYEIIKSADIHATAFSTCALEAPSFGVPNIMINIDNMAREYYQDFLSERSMTSYVETPEEFIEKSLSISKWKKNDPKMKTPYILSDYKNNLDAFLGEFKFTLRTEKNC